MSNPFSWTWISGSCIWLGFVFALEADQAWHDGGVIHYSRFHPSEIPVARREDIEPIVGDERISHMQNGRVDRQVSPRQESSDVADFSSWLPANTQSVRLSASGETAYRISSQDHELFRRERQSGVVDPVGALLSTAMRRERVLPKGSAKVAKLEHYDAQYAAGHYMGPALVAQASPTFVPMAMVKEEQVPTSTAAAVIAAAGTTAAAVQTTTAAATTAAASEASGPSDLSSALVISLGISILACGLLSCFMAWKQSQASEAKSAVDHKSGPRASLLRGKEGKAQSEAKTQSDVSRYKAKSTLGDSTPPRSQSPADRSSARSSGDRYAAPVRNKPPEDPAAKQGAAGAYAAKRAAKKEPAAASPTAVPAGGAGALGDDDTEF